MRITRDDMLMEFATAAAKRSTCNRAHVGAVIAREGRCIATGYAGAPKGLPHCGPETCHLGQPCTRTIHAEQNAIAFAARHGVATEGATLYCTHSPCPDCAKLIINSGITRVVYAEEYRKKEGIELLRSVGITVDHWAESGHPLREVSELGVSGTRLHVGQGAEASGGDDRCGSTGGPGGSDRKTDAGPTREDAG